MESRFTKGNSNNLPRIDVVMLGKFFASNSDFCSSEFRNVKTSMSSRDSYGDDAVSYVQVKREDEEEENVLSVRCEDCVASQGGCKHAIAFLMWIHRRSEEPSCTSIECYWKKSKLSRVGSSLKYITAKELSKGNPVFPGNSSALKKFLQEAKKRKVADCELLKYQPTHCVSDVEAISMHQLAYSHKKKDVEDFLGKYR
ncbi:uncharacterized protein LOC124538099 [Vanessa cardui]|uniref:uncharacterized protein LOC124538099 n=1 Tax=Vanessa cardui TaxID=171605 RepID=UPI001F13397C|nr:uncharacterized protein LOC124538099 [Vanessa cardui]